MKRNVFVVLRIVVGLGLLVFLFNRINSKEVLTIISRVSMKYWLISVGLLFFGVWISSVKLAVFLKVFGINIKILKLVKIYLVGCFVGNFLPGTVGGDIAKFAFIHKHASSKSDVVFSIFAERFTGLLAVLFVSVCGVIYYYGLIDNFEIFLTIILANLVSIAAFILFRVIKPVSKDKVEKWEAKYGKVIKLFCRGHIAINTIGKNNKVMLISLVISFIFVLDSILVSYIFAKALDLDIKFIEISAMVALVQTITMVPISINGVGVREWAYIYLLGKCNISPEPATAISFMVYLSVVVVSLVGGVFFVIGNRKDRV